MFPKKRGKLIKALSEGEKEEWRIIFHCVREVSGFGFSPVLLSCEPHAPILPAYLPWSETRDGEKRRADSTVQMQLS